MYTHTDDHDNHYNLDLRLSKVGKAWDPLIYDLCRMMQRSTRFTTKPMFNFTNISRTRGVRRQKACTA